MAKIKVTKQKSAINRTKRQKLTLEALGLKKIGQTVEHEDTPNILGMINKLKHLVSVQEAESNNILKMNLSNLKPAEGSVKNQGKRVGRGQGSGKGGTATRGHKGAKSRSGYSRKIGFEGGQMPLQRRVPKFGFTNINRKDYQGINLDTLQKLVDEKKIKSELDFTTIIELRLARKNELVKILGRGELKAKLKVSAHKFTATAKAAIEAAGGEVVTL